MKEPITIIDYGMGNIGSLQNMFRRLGVDSRISNDASEIGHAAKLLLPGVGAFDAAMARINACGLYDVIRHRALSDKIPLLGICLGMQLLTDGSDEGRMTGLGLVPGKAHKFPDSQGLKVPHMGWNIVRPTNISPITSVLEDDARFYFVHSYYVEVDHAAHSILSCDYGITFDAAIQRDNIFGAQFHPEKSHKFGMAFLEAFAEL